MAFFGNRTYLVIGASKNPEKYGYKVLKWYLDRNLNVVPINPTTPEVLGAKTKSSILEALANGHEYSLSVITPPDVSYNSLKEVLESVKGDLVKSIWFQPNSYDKKLISYLNKKGFYKNKGNLIYNDCILVSGDSKL
ncbi:hypothetical protein LJB42_002792 [Komagataella kurtzmanii]|nr:hypothetical protein LJB42_002792 [Komagataella kurtzmanii]